MNYKQGTFTMLYPGNASLYNDKYKFLYLLE